MNSNKAEQELAKTLEEVLNDIFEMIGTRLRQTRTLTKVDLDRLTNFKKYGYDIEAINDRLKKVCDEIGVKFEDLFDETLEENKEKAKQISKYKKQQKDTPLITDRVNAIKKLTEESLFNISNTTTLFVIDRKGHIVALDKYYKHAIDKAILSNNQGLTGWKQEINKIINELGRSGLRVVYESGYTRRVDSAIRQNVLGGIRDINLEMQKNIGERWGSDGVEITAHALCAEDHLPYQGKQYTNKEFEALQGRLHREIGQWNCGHMAIPIFLGISKPLYSQEKLDEYKRSSTEQVDIGGITKTRYQWSQEMRRLECQIRDARNELSIAKGIGDKAIVAHYKSKLKGIRAEYDNVSKIAHIAKRM